MKEPAALFEILGGYFSSVFGKVLFFSVGSIESVVFGPLHSTTWDYYSVEMNHLMMDCVPQGSILFYSIRKPLHFEDRDLKNKNKITDFHALGHFN